MKPIFTVRWRDDRDEWQERRFERYQLADRFARDLRRLGFEPMQSTDAGMTDEEVREAWDAYLERVGHEGGA